MRESFIFYKSFMDAVETIPSIKYKYLLLESIIKVGLFSAEIENFSEKNNKKVDTFIEESCKKLITFIEETEQKLSKNSQVLGMFFAIKPQIVANYKKYLNGLKGKQYGGLGGAPKGNKNASKNNPKTTPNVNVNDNVNDNVNENENENEKNTPHPYGNFQNVYLTDKQKAEFECLVMDKKTADTLIENLSESIASKKEQIFDENYPDMHLIRLKKYWQYWRTSPQSHKNHLSMSQVGNLVDETIKKLAERKTMK